MKNMRIPLYVSLGIMILGIIFGSFYDYQLSSAIASSTNGFALTISAIAPTIGFAGLTFLAGGFVGLALQKESKTWMKILFFILAAAGLFAGVYYSGPEYFGVNGFYEAAPKFVGYLIALLPLSGACVGGYFVFRKCENKTFWIILVIAYVVMILALLGSVVVLKDIMHRPRFRTVSTTDVPFHNWWEPTKDYKEYMNSLGIAKEEFKSYPSGHTCEASVLLVAVTLAPLGNEKLKKYQLPAYIASFLFVILTGFARILAAAHYLSDVSTGGAAMIIFLIVANEIIIKVKALQPANEEIAKE